MFYIHILTDSKRIENKNNLTYHVLTEEQEQLLLSEGIGIREHIYKQCCGEQDIEICCPEIRDKEAQGGHRQIILPEFLIPRRPYPVYVYLYAITVYCSNPMMGQREAAKRTRERFGLKTFNHTTLGRAMKNLEGLIKKYEETTLQAEEEGADGMEIVVSGEFPTVTQTKNRREKVMSYLMKASTADSSLTEEAVSPLKRPNYKRPPYNGAFIDACHKIVRYTFLNHGCLLL